MEQTFKVGDRVTVAPSAYSRAGETGVIVILDGDDASVRFDDGEELGFLLDDDELLSA